MFSISPRKRNTDMRRLENEPIAIQEIIDRGLISPHFQPLVSMKKTRWWEWKG
jgi:hypothetical protein